VARPTDAAGGPGARLRIGCIAELALQRVQSFLGALYAFDPDLAIELRHLPSAAQRAALRSGELELGLLCDTGDRDGIDVVPIFAGERVAVVVPAGHRIAGHAVVSTGELRGERLLTAPRGADPAVHDALMARARDAGLEFRSVCPPRGPPRASCTAADVAGARRACPPEPGGLQHCPAIQRGASAVLRFRKGQQRATRVELFFDLVFVFAITQLSALLVSDISVAGAARVLFLLLVVWWAWIYTTWMTNWFDPVHLSVRLVLIACMLAAFLMAIAIPDAFGDRALLFAGGYVALQWVRNTFVVMATDDSEPMRASWVRMWIGSLWVGLIWIAGAIAPDEGTRALIWLAALFLDYGGPLAGFWAPGIGRTAATEWELDHGHFAERFELFVMIVLGESIVVTGAAASHLDLTPERSAALVVAFLGTAVYFWLYFDEVADRAADRLANAGPERGVLARDAFTYLHIPIVAGMLVTAVGDELVIAHPLEPLHGEQLVALIAGPALYLLGHVAFELRLTRTLPRQRAVAALILLALAPLGTILPVLATWTLAYGVLAVVAWLETHARLWGRPEDAGRPGWAAAGSVRHVPVLRRWS
jgi:low temperature requirement protein LtrA